MSFHPNSMHMASSRPQTHVYGAYPGPGGMAGKPAPAGASQIGGGTAGFQQMYFVQGAPYAAYPPGVDGKYSGGGRGVPDQPGVIVGMAPSGMLYQGQHMPTSGAMLIPGGQQMIMRHPSQIYQQPGAHQPRVPYASAPPPPGQYSIGGGAGVAGGPMAQQLQQQQPQQQQQYYGGGYAGNQQLSQPTSAGTVPKREKKILQIVNPDTGKAVNLNADQEPSTAPNDVDTAATTLTETIAAQFAAQVAATLSPSASSFAPQRTNAVASGIEEKTDTRIAVPSVSKVDPPLPTEGPAAPEKCIIPPSELNSKDIAQHQVTSSSDAIAEPSSSSSVNNEDLDIPSVADSSLLQSSAVAPETENHKSSKPETSPQLQASLPLKPTEDNVSLSTAVDEINKSKNIKSTSNALSIVKDDVQSSAAQHQLTKASVNSAAAAGSATLSESSSACAVDNGNKKKNRKKNKDLNSKGKVLQGSDMDAFIDGSRADDEKSESSKPPSPTSLTVVEAIEAAEKSVAADEDHVTANALKVECGFAEKSPTVAVTASSSVPSETVSETNETIPLEAEKTKAASSNAERCETQDAIVSQSGDSKMDCVAKNVVPKDDVMATVDVVMAPPSEETPREDGLVAGKSGAKENSGSTETFEACESTKTAVVAEDKEREGEDAESGSGTELEPPVSASTKLNNKMELKYTYSEDQWSPLNPEGKKQYDRSFMLQLQFANPSIIKPTGLPSLPDIILNEPRVKNDFSRQNSSVDPSSPIDFTPGFIKQSMGGSGMSRSSLKKGGGGSGMKRGSEQPRKVINVSLEQNITLHSSDNAWKPVLGKPSKEGELATDDLYKKIRGILNKLTPQKFQTLIQQVQHLPIDSEERLTGCIDIMFEKAISEPNFSVAYANMAKCLMTISVPGAANPAEMIGFRKLLLNKCQQEFEKDKMEENDIANLESQIRDASSDEKRKALIEQRDDTIYRAKRRSLGNIRFIGELFKLKMLTEKIMHECLNKLLKSYKDEDSLECLCQLLTTIGQDIDKKQPGATIMSKYFADLQELIDHRKTSARIRFMIQDVIELRKNKWVPRRENNNPKTIEQIHKEAKLEEQEKQLALQKFTQDQRNQRSTPTPNRVVPMTQNPHANDDGWTAVGRAPKSIVDPSRMKLTKQPMDENFQLGPGGKGMSAWHRGSNGGAKAQESERPTSTPNRFSALGGFGSESMDAKSRTNSRIGGDYTGRLSGPQSRGQASRRSQERPGSEISFRGPGAVGRSAAALSPTGSRSASQEMRSGRDGRVPVRGTAGEDISKAADEGKEISEEEIEKKTKSLMDEYLHGHDIKEAALCVKELGSSKSLQLFVYHSLLHNLERSTQARHFTGMLHLHLVKTKQMTVNHYIEGLRSILEFADEMTIDIPRIWEYLGELISPMIEDGTVSMAFLRVASEPLLGCDKAGLVIAHVLHSAAHSLGHHKAAELWHASGLKWTDFVKPESLDLFLQEQKLQFTEEKRPETGNSLSSEQVQERLAKLLENSETTVEKLIDCIDDSVDEETACSTSFIRAFTSSLCSSCVLLQKNRTVDQAKLKKFLPALSKYVKSRKDLEVQVLFALQALVHKLEHPPGVLRAFFDTLYDDEVIGEESFYEWRNSSEPSESAGKGVALQTVIQFFHWLEENEDGS